MNEPEYEKAIELQEEANKKKVSMINMKFAMSNNSVTVGDIVEDRRGKLRVERIAFTGPSILYGSLPCCIYHGPRLTKKGEARKDGVCLPVYQVNLINPTNRILK
jgi:hypothetical protein